MSTELEKFPELLFSEKSKKKKTYTVYVDGQAIKKSISWEGRKGDWEDTRGSFWEPAMFSV